MSIMALMGNQNCGKTTLFNQLTGSKQHVGNFPGVTVEKKEGRVKKHADITVVDLPGIYSLSPYTNEEIVSRNFLIDENPDVIVNIVDATNIERNLYLTLQLIEMRMPMVIALNMMDELRESGGSIDVLQMEKELGIPVISICASKNEGVDELMVRAIETASTHQLPQRLDFCAGEVHKALHAIAHIIEDKAKRTNYSVRFAATKCIERDEFIQKALKLDAQELDIIDHVVDDMESHLGTDNESALADMRYSFIEQLCEKTVHKHGESKAQKRSERIDKVLTHKYFALPIFLGIMLLIFYLTFGPVGTFLGNLFGTGIDAFTSIIDTAMTNIGISFWMHSLVVDGILNGIGSVLSFLPIILLLFFFLSLLEDTGYMTRVAYIMDRLLRKLGLSGRSFVPMLIGFGCTVPAIMATRTLPSERDRKITVLLAPFMSCSAKLPIYAVFTAAFFPQHGAIVMTALYVLGIVVAVLVSLLLNKTLFRGNAAPFVMELPAYRLPTAKNVLLHMWDKAMDFIRRAFTIIFVASVVIWVLQTLDWRFNMASDNARSILASIGALIAPLFGPLGFGDWRASTALITGLTAKETVVSTFSILLGVQGKEALSGALGTLFTPLSAASFLVFTLLYMPCVAAFAATRRELGGLPKAVGAMTFQTATAWIVALIVYQGGLLLGLG